ncbi:PQQ-dependent sugar dehydrogenase [Chitinophaga sp. 22620]|uniref:PQQ-dependent sugar dehydrogenase n=1 Tax=Chitinophaga sp. 22620 TaxID=3453952 RepID=UPI003F85D611
MKINSTQAAGLTLRITGTFAAALFGALLLHGCKKFDDKPNKAVTLQLIADNLVSPLGATESPDNTGRLFILDQVGKIWIVDKDGNKLPAPFIDVTGIMVPLNAGYDERGLLGFAFHPDYKQNGKFYIYYNRPRREGTSFNNLSRIAEFKVSANPNMADMASEKVLLDLDDPQGNHNGGTLAFGPDGYLYIAIGDGGGANDVAPGHVMDWYLPNAGGNGQDIDSNLFGNILRIDVNSGSPYSIPASNPFVGKAGKDEIWAYGFRNPFRFSFDMGGNHWLYAGDAGQVLYEEIDVVTKGGNYGWNVKEGTHCFNAANNSVELPGCPNVDVFGANLIDPVIEINNSNNPAGGRMTTVIGGNVYRGNKIPEFRGKYLFGSFSQPGNVPNGELFISSPRSGDGLWSYTEVTLKDKPSDLGYYLKGFGQDMEGEVYLTVSSMAGPSGNTGKVFKLVKEKGHGHDDDDDDNRGHGGKR